MLVSAPTGTGKTLAAFLAILSELVADHQRGSLGTGVQAVYVSPLRALGYDVQRNLERPLAEICAGFLPGCAEGEPPPVRVASRTGDTTPADRRRLVTQPPHVLVTTPESLAILLTTAAFRPHLRSVRWVVVDEVHAVAANKRGAHLALSLERLADLSRCDPVRVGLSATVAPLDVVARWLGGARRRVEMVAWQTAREATFAVRSAITGEVVPSPQAVQRAAAEAVAERVARHRTTLVFTNTRGATERLAHRLKQRFGEEDVAAHHSSLDREERLRVEQALRDGHLRAVVSSTSLELGIDIGTVDETVLVSSPRDVTRAIQRVGRSGHRIDRHPAGLFVATGVDDLVECQAVAERCRAGTLDPMRPPAAPLDVLAQTLVGIASEGREPDGWVEADDAFRLVRRSAPYAKLSRADFDAVLDYLAESSEAMEERRVYAKVERDGTRFRARGRSVQTIFYQNVGTIAGGASVRVKPRGASTPVGTVEEEFLENVRPGDRFLLGGRVWSFMYAQGMTAFVAPASGRPSVPRWASEVLPASPGVALGVAELRSWMASVLRTGTAAADHADERGSLLGARRSVRRTLKSSHGLHGSKGSVPTRRALPSPDVVKGALDVSGTDPRPSAQSVAAVALVEAIVQRFGIGADDAAALAEYAAAQERLSPVPAPDEILVERWADTEDPKVLVHAVTSPLGRRANDALARAVALRAGKASVGLMVEDQAFALRVPKRAAWTDDDLAMLFDPTDLAEDVRRAVARSDLWGRRFRQVAAVGLMLVKNYHGRSKFVGGMQHNARKIWSVLERERPDFPLVRETYRTVLEDDLDVPGALDWLQRCGTRRTLRDLPSPPPYAFRMLAAGTTDAMLLEERDAFLRRLWEEARGEPVAMPDAPTP